jgi:hypothetical protein
MFQFLLRVKALERLGLSRPLRYLFLIGFVIALMAGLVYAAAIFNAVNNQGSPDHHVPPHSTH